MTQAFTDVAATKEMRTFFMSLTTFNLDLIIGIIKAKTCFLLDMVEIKWILFT